MQVRSKWFLGLVIGLAGCGGSSDGMSATESKSATVVAGGAEPGASDGPLATATFRNPANVAVDSDGTVFVCDFDNDLVRKIEDGQVTTLVAQTNFSRPFGITIGVNGTLYVQTDANDEGERNGTTGTVWRVDKTTGAATVVARNLGRPRGILALPDGRIAMANLTRSTVELLDPATGAVTPLAGQVDTPGFAEGTGTAAQFNRPYGLTRDSDGSLLVADQNNHRIRRVTLAGVVTTFAGTGAPGSDNGAVGAATFNGPQDVDRAPNGRIYVADTTGHLIREIRGGQVTTFAGDGTAGFSDAAGTGAKFFGLEGMAIAPNGRTLYVADGSGGEEEPYHRVRLFRL